MCFFFGCHLNVYNMPSTSKPLRVYPLQFAVRVDRVVIVVPLRPMGNAKAIFYNNVDVFPSSFHSFTLPLHHRRQLQPKSKSVQKATTATVQSQKPMNSQSLCALQLCYARFLAHNDAPTTPLSLCVSQSPCARGLGVLCRMLLQMLHPFTLSIKPFAAIFSHTRTLH